MITIMDIATGHYECESASVSVSASGDFIEKQEGTGYTSLPTSSPRYAPMPCCQLALQEVAHSSAKYRARS